MDYQSKYLSLQMERSFVHVVHQLQHNLSNFDYEPSVEVDNVVRKLKPLLLLCHCWAKNDCTQILV